MTTTVVIYAEEPVNIILPEVETPEEEGIFDETFDETFE